MKRTILISLLYALTAAPLVQAQTLRLTNAECRQMALQHDELMQSADNAVQQAELERQATYTNYLPKLDASLMGFYRTPNSDMMGMDLIMKGLYVAGITVQQPLYAGGKITAANRLTAIAKDCAEQQMRKTRMDLIADADNAYWTYVAVLDKVRMLETYTEYMQSLYNQVQISVEAEMATRNDLLRVSAKQSEIAYQLQKARTGVELCRLNLCHIIGADFDTPINPADTEIAVSAPAALSDDIEQNPDLALLRKNIDVKKEQVKVARADFLPQAGLSLGYNCYGNLKVKGMTSDGSGGYTSVEKNYHDGGFQALVSLAVPIFHWGEGSKKVKKAQLDVENAQLELQRNQRLLSIQARQAISNVTDGYLMIQTAQQGVDQADENLRVMRDKYDANIATLTDLLDAQAQWQQARSNLIEAKTQYKIYQTEYQKAVGTLD